MGAETIARLPSHPYMKYRVYLHVLYRDKEYMRFPRKRDKH